MRRQAQDVATNLPGMTNREALSETVAVPVELLKELIEIVSFHKGSTPAGRQATALLPKPKPRLVAVTRDEFREGYFIEWFDAEPDLLSLLDDLIDREVLSTRDAGNLKGGIRTALGVTE